MVAVLFGIYVLLTVVAAGLGIVVTVKIIRGVREACKR